MDRIDYIREKRQQFQQKKRLLFNNGHWKTMIIAMLFVKDVRIMLLKGRAIKRMREYQLKCYGIIQGYFHKYFERQRAMDSDGR